MRWCQFFCVLLLLLLFTHHCIVVFHDMSSSSKWCITTLSFSISFSLIFILLHNTVLMGVIPASFRFVIISFWSFFIVVMFSSMHTKLPVLILYLLNLCMSLLSTFLCQVIFFMSLCMPLIATFFHHIWGMCMPLIARFSSSWKHVVGDTKPGLNLGFDMNVEKTRVNYVIKTSELHGCMFPGFLLLHPDND